MKKFKLLGGSLLMGAFLCLSLAFSNSTNAKNKTPRGLSWVEKPCPPGTQGYRCEWDFLPDSYPDCRSRPPRNGSGIYACYVR